MASLRVQGLSNKDEIESLNHALSTSCKPLRWKIAPQSQDTFEASITFEDDSSRKQALKVLSQLIADNGYARASVDDTFDGLTVLWSQEPLVDIVAVHGLGGHAADTWTFSSHPSINLWLRDLLPQNIPRSRIITFGYDSAIMSRNTAQWDDIARSLLNRLMTKRRSKEEKARPIIFMAHSLGGLIVKVALKISKYEEKFDNVDHLTLAVVFFGTPHRGSSKASWGATLANIINIVKTANTHHLEALKKDSDALFNLGADFAHILRANQTTLFSVYELKKTKLGILRSSLIVPKDSAVLNIEKEDKIPVNATHRDVCKFHSENDGDYVTLVVKIEDLVKKTIGLQHTVSRRVERDAEDSGSVTQGGRWTESRDTPSSTHPSHYPMRHVLTYPKVIPPERYFFGRKSMLETIEAYLYNANEDHFAPRCFALFGDPAVGKTSLVKQVIQRTRKWYDLVLMFTAESKPKLSQEFMSVGRQLEISTSLQEDPAVTTIQVLDFLRTSRKRFLIVYDNVDESGFLHSYWPYEGNGSVLVTTRDVNIARKLPGEAETLHVQGLTEDEGEQFLLNRIGASHQDDETRALARSAAKHFNCWPLALSQVSAWMVESRTNLRQFCDMLSQNRNSQAAIEEAILAYKDEGSQYERALATAWEPILTSLDHKSATLLSVLSLMDPDGIPEHLFLQDRDTASGQETCAQVVAINHNSSRRPLFKYNIIDIANDALRVHRIVQSTRLKTICTMQRNEAFEQALSLLCQSFPRQELGAHMWHLWADCRTYSPHVLHFDDARAKYAWKPSSEDARKFINMMCDCTWYLWEIGEFKEAISRITRLRSVCIATLGPETLEEARLCVNHGSVLSTLNRYSEASPLFLKGLRIREKLLPPDDHMLANSYMQVGNVYISEERYSDAIQSHTNVIIIRKKNYKSAPGMMIISYLNLSRSLLGAGEYDAAEDALENARACYKDVMSESEIQGYDCSLLYVLGNIHLARGDLDRAKTTHIEAYESKKRMNFTPFSLSASSHKIGHIKAMLGDYEAASCDLMTALEILDTAAGNSDLRLKRYARSEMKLSEVLSKARRYAEAAQFEKRAFAHYSEATKANHEIAGPVDFDKLAPYIDR